MDAWPLFDADARRAAPASLAEWAVVEVVDRFLCCGFELGLGHFDACWAEIEPVAYLPGVVGVLDPEVDGDGEFLRGYADGLERWLVERVMLGVDRDVAVRVIPAPDVFNLRLRGVPRDRDADGGLASLDALFEVLFACHAATPLCRGLLQ